MTQLRVPMPLNEMPAGAVLVLEALDATTDAPVANVVLTEIAIYGNSLAEPPGGGSEFEPLFLPLPVEA